MKMKTNITSAAGIISLLDEPMSELKIFALKKLDEIVDEFWPEISESIEKIEMLHEDKIFGQHQLAALVASKVFYHLGSFEDALTYALGAGDLFDVNARNEYVDTIIAKCIDFYIQQRIAFIDNPADAKPVDARLEAIVNRMIQRCLEDGQFRQALGIALETRRMDIFETAILKSDDINGMLAYAFQVAMSLIQNRGFRNSVLRCLVTLYRSLAVPDYVNMCQCLIFLEDPMAVAEILDKLITSGDLNVLMGYQIAFDLYESATQQFLSQVLQALRETAPIPSLLPSIYNPQGTSTATGTTTTTATTTVTSSTSSTSSTTTTTTTTSTSTSTTPKSGEKTTESTPLLKSDEKMDEDIDLNVATNSNISSTNKAVAISTEGKIDQTIENLSKIKLQQQQNIGKLVNILSGEPSIDFQVQFLIRSNHADLQILRATKDAVRVSICHTATVIANAFMHSGTTSDQFLRDNLEWLARATNWAKLTATASLGVIHRGHEYDSLALMQSYLPKETGPSSGYSEGGGLYALGLIHANHGANIIDYLLQQLKDAQNENVRHGGCLGLGLAAMGTHRQDLYEQLKFNLYQDDAVTGEAAGIAMGMVMLGSKNAQSIEDMVSYAQETQHEKILRGLAVGIALTMYARLEEAEALVTNLSTDKDPVLRRSGMYTLAMAYCGTGSNKAIRKLLHVAVSDVNDDVRRAAVTSIGFILFRTPEQCPSVVSLLAESYNPHVRYGAAMALGIACAGTGLREAIALLEPMVKFDPVNFVRQGALIASAMILIQHTDQTCPKTSFFRSLYSEVITNKHEDVMAKYGAILSQGIIDAGGRNVTVSLQSRTGHTNLQAVVGMLVFTQYWYWFPLAHCLSLAFTPTCIIGLNSDLNMPKIEYKSAAKPSLYAYPPPLEEKKTEEREKVATAVLSIAARQKRRETADKKDDEKMEVDEDVKEVLKDVKMEDITITAAAAATNAATADTVVAATTSTAATTPIVSLSSTTTTTSQKKIDVIKTFKSIWDDKDDKRDKKDEKKSKNKEEIVTSGTAAATTITKDDEKDGGKDKDKSTERKDPEPNFEILQNPARALRQQLKVISVVDGQYYVPLKDITIGGIIVMQHTSADEQTIIEPVAAHGPKNEEANEPEPPESFEYTED